MARPFRSALVILGAVLAGMISLVLIGCGSSAGTQWDSAQPRTIIVTTQRAVLTGKVPICLVTHAESGEWAFVTNETSGEFAFIDMSVTTSLDVLLRLDPSIGQVAELPRGRKATRKTPADSWEEATLEK